MTRENKSINYLALLLVVVAGVVIGNLVSDWISARLAAYEGQRALAELKKSAAAGADRAREIAVTQAQKAASALANQQEQAREQRRRDREGLRLGQTCEEWRKADAELNSQTTHAEMTKHCGVYERYVQHGILPAKK